MTNSQSDPDELLDLVDLKDQVIGQARRSLIYARGWSNFRVVNAFLRNRNGQLWIPRRASEKQLFPSCLDVSMGGHVKSGEAYDEALARELREELNLELTQIRCRPLGCLVPHKNGVSAFMRVFEICEDKVPPYNPRDFSEYFWLYPHEVLDRLSSGDQSKGDLPLLVRIFYLNEG